MMEWKFNPRCRSHINTSRLYAALEVAREQLGGHWP